MKKNASVVVLAALVVFLGRCHKPPDKVLLGSWNVSSYVSPAEAAKKSEEPLPPGASMEMSISGSTTFHAGEKYNEDGEVTIRLRMGEKEVPLRFYVREAGTWKVHGDVLVETAEDSLVTALDDTTKEVLNSDPELKQMMAPVKGESTSYKLKEVSDSKVTMEEQEYGMTVILQRKS